MAQHYTTNAEARDENKRESGKACCEPRGAGTYKQVHMYVWG